MTRSMFHQVEPGATGPHADFVMIYKDFPEPDPWSSDGQQNPH